LAKEFARQGHSVKVITLFENSVDYEILTRETKIQFKNLGCERYRSIKLRGKKVASLINSLINRSLLMLIEYPNIQFMPLVIKALRDESDYDMLISIAVPYPVHWGVAWSRNFKHKIANKWVADCGDPYTGDQMDTFRKLFYFSYIEKWAFRKADYITINVPNGEKSYFHEFHHKIKYIPQGVNFNDIRLSSESISNGPVTFGYAGGFIPNKRDPRPFLDFLSNLEIDFRFIIFTKKKELIKDYEEKMPEKISIKDYIPREQLIYLFSSFDFLVNFDNNRDATFPSKLIDYALTKRPILNIKSDLEIPIILEFLSRDYSKALVIKDIEQFNISKVSKQFIELA
jgi:hypothetical protein